MNDFEFLINWQQWPVSRDGHSYCCLTRDGSDGREHAFLLSGYPDLYYGNIFDGGSGEMKQYGNMQEIVNEGWRVD